MYRHNVINNFPLNKTIKIGIPILQPGNISTGGSKYDNRKYNPKTK